MKIEMRLKEYGLSLLEPGQGEFLPSNSPWEQIREMQYNAGARATGFAYEMIEGVPCIPDGGLWEILKVERIANAVEKSRRVEDVKWALTTIPRHHKLIIEATYCAEVRERIPRDPDAVAAILHISRDEVFDQLTAALQWMEYKLCLVHERAA